MLTRSWTEKSLLHADTLGRLETAQRTSIETSSLAQSDRVGKRVGEFRLYKKERRSTANSPVTQAQVLFPDQI